MDRAVLGRIREAVRRRLRMFSHRGSNVHCPVCDHAFAEFGPGPEMVCWRCGAHARHRLLWLYLQAHPELLQRAGSLLHFAPEWGLERRLREVLGLRYTTADLRPDKGQLVLDITRMTLAEHSFDAILCSHVLEHVEDDRAAMRELHRVLSPGGWAIVMVPLDFTASETREDPAVTSPQERERRFGQHDHLRLYALDIVDRLTEAGFEVQRERFASELGSEQASRFGLAEYDEIYLCRRA